MNPPSLIHEFLTYLLQIRSFKREDWSYYIRWIGLMCGLLLATTGFLISGELHNVSFPGYVWDIPAGILVFVLAIAVDTIGHRTRYRERLAQGESFVHTITIFVGIASVVSLCLGYSNPDEFHVPSLVLIGLSIFYSGIDEWMHWRRYMAGESDRIEMWSHVFILIGHITMSLAWWRWFTDGYPGVRETIMYQ